MPDPHQRKLIRHAVIAMLKGKTAVGQRVTGTRIQPHKDLELPAISVYTPNDKTLEESKENSPRELWVTLRLVVTGFLEVIGVSAGDDLQDPLDDLAQEIQNALDVDVTLLDTCTDSVLDSTDCTFNSDGDPMVGMVTLTYEVTYISVPIATTNLADFRTVKSTTKIVGVTDDNTVTDQFTVQETPP